MGVIVEYNATTRAVQPPYTTGDYESLIGKDHLVNPDLTSLVQHFTSRLGRTVPYVPFRYIVDPKYWKYESGNIVEMTQPEKDAVDAAELAEQTTRNRQRTIAELNSSRVLKASLLVILNQMNLRHGTNITPTQFLNAIVDKINNGDVD